MRYLTDEQRHQRKIKKAKFDFKYRFFMESVGFLRAAVCPDRCVLCGEVIKFQDTICKNCRKKAPVIKGERCIACGMLKAECDCKLRSNFYSGIVAPFKYTSVAKTGILNWKFNNADYNTDFFADMVVAAIKDAFKDVTFDIVTFVPQTKNDEDKKGASHGEIIAQAVAKRLELPFAQLLIKIFATEKQHNTKLYLKSGNIFGVFECQNQDLFEGKTVLIVDDVKTSGKTLNECAKMLELYGTQNVYCATIGITMPPQKKQENKKTSSSTKKRRFVLKLFKNKNKEVK